MGSDAIELLDLVALLRDVPEHGLVRGEIGTVVEVYDDAVEVEFSDDEGRTYGQLALRPEQGETVHAPPGATP